MSRDYYYFTAKIDGTCWNCGDPTYMGITTVVYFEGKYLCTNCFEPSDDTDDLYCGETTKAGNKCPNRARENSFFCHIHDPAVQCGAIKKNGTLCAVATGGGRCKFHKKPKPVGREYSRLRRA